MIPFMNPLANRSLGGRVRAMVGGILILTVSAGCGQPEAVGALKRLKQAKSAAVAEIEARGGTATIKDYGPGSGYILDLRTVPIDDDFLAELTPLKHITEIDLSDSDVTDEQLQKLAKVRGVGVILKLDVSGTQIGDAGIMAFVKHNLLCQLDVQNSNVTPAAIKKFKKQHPVNMYKIPLEVKQ